MPKKTAELKRQELDVAYEDAYRFVMHYLDEIQGRVHDMPAPESDELTWGHVGDMQKIKSDLRDVVRFLANDETYT